MSEHPRRRSSLKNASSAPATWATVLALVTTACGGGVESTSSSSSSSGSSPTNPPPAACQANPCGTYIELPDGGTEVYQPSLFPDGGAPDPSTVKTCFCGNG
jgi:hypothetical protein